MSRVLGGAVRLKAREKSFSSSSSSSSFVLGSSSSVTRWKVRLRGMNYGASAVGVYS